MNENPSSSLPEKKRNNKKGNSITFFFRSLPLSLCVCVCFFFLLCLWVKRKKRQEFIKNWMKQKRSPGCLHHRRCRQFGARPLCNRSFQAFSTSFGLLAFLFFCFFFFVYVFGIKEKYIDDFHCFYLCNFPLKLNFTRRIKLFSTQPYYSEHDALSF